MTSVNNIYKAVILITAFFVSCSNSKSKEDITELNKQKDSLAIEVANDIQIVYTDSAVLRAKINAPLMKRSAEKKNPYVEMPNGIHADFYGPKGDIQSTLTAKYAINYENKDIIEIRDSVRVLNKNDEEIKSNELIWDKKKRMVYSDKPVRVRIRDEKIIKAEGFESEETFMRYTFKKVTGIVYLNEDMDENPDPKE